YEASAGRVLPYVVLPGALAIGAALLPFPGLREVALAMLALGALGLGTLALGLTVWGLRADARYPGLRFAALEIPRRWATVLGAFQGLLRYGWSGRRGMPSDSGDPVERRPPTSLAGKP
ncbi:MAG TPA: hypothetical protein VGS23_05965, partial [Thermoplasmata archaeon]|nr:hypothetical protein [Thermoplasmata archaeon]